MNRAVVRGIGVVVLLLLLAALVSGVVSTIDPPASDPARSATTTSADAISTKRVRHAPESAQDDESESEPDEATIVARQSVRVIRPDGSPVGGARVTFHDDPRSLLAPGAAEPSIPPRWRGATGPDGRVTIPLVSLRNGLLVVRGRDFAAVSETLRPVPDAPERIVVAVPTPPLRLRLVDLLGEPVPDAEVWVGNLDAPRDADQPVMWPPVPPRPVVRGRSGADGRLALHGVPHGRRPVFVALDRSAPRPVAIVLSPSTDELDVPVRIAGTLSGRVTDKASGRPLANARVTFYVGDVFGFEGERWIGAVVSTDARGRYVARFPGVRDTLLVHRCRVESSEHDAFLDVTDDQGDVGIWMRSQAHLEHDIQATRGAPLSGRVAAEALPAGGIQVFLYHDQAQGAAQWDLREVPSRAAEVGAGGEFVFPRIAPGSYTLEVHSRRVDPVHFDELRTSTASFVLPPSPLASTSVYVGTDGAQVTIELPGDEAGTPTRLRGRVLDAGSRWPVAGARVAIGSSDGDEVVWSNSSGEFEVTRDDGGDAWFLGFEISAPSYPPVWTSFSDPEQGPTDVLLEKGLATTGRVTGAGGEPVAGAEVRLCYGEEIVSRTRTDSGGAFLAVVARGYEHLDVRVLGPDGSEVVRCIEVAPEAERIDVPTIDLSATRTFSGRVLDASTGRPIAGVIVGRSGAVRNPAVFDDWEYEPSSHEVTMIETVTDEQGRFVLRGLPDEEFQLHFAGPRVEDHASVVDAGVREGTFRVRSLRSISGRVRRADSGSPRGLVVYVEFADGSDQLPDDDHDFVGADGRFALHELPDAPLRIFVGAGASQDANVLPVVLDLPAGDVWDLEIPLQSGHRLTGRVVDAAGRGIEGATVVCQSVANSASWSETETDSGGGFEMSSLDASAHVVVAYTDSHASVYRANVRPSEADPLTFVLREGAVLEGELLEASGAPVANATVTLRLELPEGDPRTVVSRTIRTDTDENGRFRLTGLEDREYVVVCGYDWDNLYPPPTKHRPGTPLRLVCPPPKDD